MWAAGMGEIEILAFLRSAQLTREENFLFIFQSVCSNLLEIFSVQLRLMERN